MRSSAPHLAVAFVLLLGPVAPAQGLRHVQPERDAEVPTSGFPTWIENLTVGSPVSDFGSHAGVKASLTTDAPMHAKSLLGAAHYSGFQTNAAQVDQSLVYVVEGGRPLLAPPASREVRFHPWGWEEVARGDDLEARGAVTTLSTDAFLFVVRLVNRGATTRTLSPRVALLADGDGVHEGMFPFHASFMQKWRASLDAQRSVAKLFYRRGTPLAAFAWDRMRMDRQVAATPPIVRVRDGLTPYAPTPRRWSSTLELEERTLAPGASLDVAFVIGYGADDAAAARVLDGARPALNDPLAALRAVRAGWDADLAALPKPHAADADQARLWTIAYAGLRHNRFAATTSGQGTMNTASKIHFNAFYVWDGAMAALGESNWDPRARARAPPGALPGAAPRGAPALRRGARPEARERPDPRDLAAADPRLGHGAGPRARRRDAGRRASLAPGDLRPERPLARLLRPRARLGPRRELRLRERPRDGLGRHAALPRPAPGPRGEPLRDQARAREPLGAPPGEGGSRPST